MKRTFTAAAALLGALTALSIPAAAFASTPPTPAGVIHVYVTDSSTQGNDHKILITGAFSDHGTGNQATFYLTKGWIYLNLAGVQKIVNSSSFGSFNADSCSYLGQHADCRAHRQRDWRLYGHQGHLHGHPNDCRTRIAASQRQVQHG